MDHLQTVFGYVLFSLIQFSVLTYNAYFGLKTDIENVGSLRRVLS